MWSSGALEDFEEQEKRQATPSIPSTPPPTPTTREPSEVFYSTPPGFSFAPPCPLSFFDSAFTILNPFFQQGGEDLPPEFVEGLKKLIDELSQINTNEDAKDAASNPESEDAMKDMLEQLESSPEFQSVMEKMVDQLLSKDILYEPIKMMAEKV